MTPSPQKLIDGLLRFHAQHFKRDDGLFQVAQGKNPLIKRGQLLHYNTDTKGFEAL